MEAHEADLLLTGGYLVTDPEEAVIEDGAVAVAGDRIVAAGRTAELDGAVEAAETIDCSGQAIMAGLVDCHVHTTQQTARGLADDIPVAQWLQRIVGLEAVMDEEDVTASVRLACLEMIRSGTTAFIEACGNPLHVDAMGDAFAQSGLRGALTRSVMEREDPTWAAPPGFVMSPADNVAATARMIERWHGAADGRVSAWSGWRHQQETGDAMLRDLVLLADAYDVGVHAHLGTRKPGEIARLHSLDALRSSMVFAHGIHFTDEEAGLIKRFDVKLSHNPGASMHGAYGSSVRGRYPEFVRDGVCVGLGCDGAANNNNLDMFREMRLAATLHKEAHLEASVLSAGQALTMATKDGARACMHHESGTLVVGGKADLIVVDLQAPHIVPVHDVISSLVYAAHGSDVSLTMVDGRVLMRDRQVIGYDEGEVMEAAVASAHRVVQRWRSR